MNAKILIVDDEVNIRLMLRTALRTSGYDVVEAPDGREAIRMIEHETPDLVVLDLSMPVMDGMSMLRELRTMELSTRPRVVVLTAFGSIALACRRRGWARWTFWRSRCRRMSCARWSRRR